MTGYGLIAILCVLYFIEDKWPDIRQLWIREEQQDE